MNRTLVVTLLIVGVVILPRTLDILTRRQPPAPPGLQTPISELGAYLATVLDRPWVRASFTDFELRAEDQLTILYFELDWSLSWLPPDPAYLASRCRPIEDLVPRGMSGGFMSGDPSTDTELRYLRSAAQDPCPAAIR